MYAKKSEISVSNIEIKKKQKKMKSNYNAKLVGKLIMQCHGREENWECAKGSMSS